LGRAPLKFGLARDLIEFLEINPFWLATGTGGMRPPVILPTPADLGVSNSAVFSQVFDGLLSRALKKPKTDDAAKRHDAAELRLAADNLRSRKAGELTRFMEDCLDRLRDEEIEGFAYKVLRFAEACVENRPKDDWRNVLARRQRAALLEEYLEAQEKYQLTSDCALVTVSGVKENLLNLKSLVATINRLTRKPGGKSELAEHLGLPLASISRWLSGEREPGGEYTLRLLRWVKQQQERQTK
jgi:hypothetical protein